MHSDIHQDTVNYSAKSHWTETALDWFHRSHQSQKIVPTDPISAAWSFVHDKTGIDFIDQTIRHAVAKRDKDKPSIIELAGAGVPWTFISLAARFVVTTRQSRFPTRSVPVLPHVVLFDSNLNIWMPHMISAIRGTLLLQGVDIHLEQDMAECLSRIHFCFSTDTTPLVAALEALRQSHDETIPTLVLWDNQISNNQSNNISKTEIARQLLRLWRESSVFLVTSRHYIGLDDKVVTSRIRLEKLSQQEYSASCNGKEIRFSIGSAGILS